MELRRGEEADVHLLRAIRKIRSRNTLKVIDVIEEEAFEVIGFRIDIARNGNIDDEYRPPPALRHDLARIIAREQHLLRSSRGDHNVELMRLISQT